MRMTVVAWILAFALIVTVACDLAGPDTVPTNPGTVIANVSDSAGAPVAGVWVYVNDIPNAVGSTFSVSVQTGASGIARIAAIPAGERRVEAKPPPGYTGDALIKSVEVQGGRSVTVAFVLIRNPD